MYLKVDSFLGGMVEPYAVCGNFKIRLRDIFRPLGETVRVGSLLSFEVSFEGSTHRNIIVHLIVKTKPADWLKEGF